MKKNQLYQFRDQLVLWGSHISDMIIQRVQLFCWNIKIKYILVKIWKILLETLFNLNIMKSEFIQDQTLL